MSTGTYQFASQQRIAGRAEGKAEGKAEAVLRILKNRGIEVDDHSRQQITSCTDGATLVTWLDHSLTITTITGLFTS